MDPRVDGLLKEVALLKQRLDDLPKPEVSQGLSLIAPQVLAGPAAIITFTDIPQGYRHLKVIAHLRTSRAAELDAVNVRFNADSGSNYDRQLITATGTTVTNSVVRASSILQVGAVEADSSRADNFSPVMMDITEYSNTSMEKWLQARSVVFGDTSADADMFIQFFTGRWRSTAAITEVSLIPNVGPNFVSGCVVQLYGVR